MSDFGFSVDVVVVVFDGVVVVIVVVFDIVDGANVVVIKVSLGFISIKL